MLEETTSRTSAKWTPHARYAAGTYFAEAPDPGSPGDDVDENGKEQGAKSHGGNAQRLSEDPFLRVL
ncbi:hypothetical protein SAMD00023353_0601430 [Rosellinia necatrix]|uniref:Uncharacterized protein n=1 Tax=Rosellinia necatrix TaxID=77044 RepID=A0A1S8A5U0_ROSNE|nr:hypothetical protein SAMD00023353_0601430 [Rosellinia necatrix]